MNWPLPVLVCVVTLLWLCYSYLMWLHRQCVAGLFSCALFGLFICSLTRSVRTDPGRTSSVWAVRPEDRHLRSVFCTACGCWKPERSHHCKVCEHCILAMDHHCMWLNTCIGLYNRRYFLQTVLYGTLTAILIVASSLRYAFGVVKSCWQCITSSDSAREFPANFARVLSEKGLSEADVVWAPLFIVIAALAILLSRFLWFHVRLVAINRTTIEQMELDALNDATHAKLRSGEVLHKSGPESIQGKFGLYDVGTRRNAETLLGAMSFRWFSPFYSYVPLSNGAYWAKRSSARESDCTEYLKKSIELGSIQAPLASLPDGTLITTSKNRLNI